MSTCDGIYAVLFFGSKHIWIWPFFFFSHSNIELYFDHYDAAYNAHVIWSNIERREASLLSALLLLMILMTQSLITINNPLNYVLWISADSNSAHASRCVIYHSVLIARHTFRIYWIYIWIIVCINNVQCDDIFFLEYFFYQIEYYQPQWTIKY